MPHIRPLELLSVEPEHRDSLALTKHAALLTYTQKMPDIEVISEHVGDMRGLRRAREQSTPTPAAPDPVHTKRPDVNHPVFKVVLLQGRRAELELNGRIAGSLSEGHGGEVGAGAWFDRCKRRSVPGLSTI